MTQETNFYLEDISRMSFRKVIMPIQKQCAFHWLAKAQIKTKVYFNVEVRANPLVLAQPKFLRNRDFPNVHSLIKKLVFAERDSQYTYSGETRFFVENWQKVTTDPVILSYVEGYKISLVKYDPRILLYRQYLWRRRKNGCTSGKRGDAKKKAIAPVQNK